MTEAEVDRIVAELKTIQIDLAEMKVGLKGNGKGLFKQVEDLQDQVRKTIMVLCFIGGGGGLSAVILKLMGG